MPRAALQFTAETFRQLRLDGKGPAWSNSLFEDNAEFTMGMRLTVDKFKEYALELLEKCAQADAVDKTLAEEIRQAVLLNDPSQDTIEKQRQRIIC